jgi:hypothetical protein
MTNKFLSGLWCVFLKIAGYLCIIWSIWEFVQPVIMRANADPAVRMLMDVTAHVQMATLRAQNSIYLVVTGAVFLFLAFRLSDTLDEEYDQDTNADRRGRMI